MLVRARATTRRSCRCSPGTCGRSSDINGLSALAERAIVDLGIDNVTFVAADGWNGLPDQAPFDAINVAAATDAIPRALERQLADGGRLVAPVGSREQHLVLVRRSGDRVIRRQLEAVQFVPLVHGTSE